MGTKIFSILQLFFAISILPVLSQPVLTESGILSLPGDTVIYGYQGVGPIITDIQGPDVTWYFTYSPTLLTPKYFITKDPAQTPFPSSFPSANRCEIDTSANAFSTKYSFQKVSGGVQEEMGIIDASTTNTTFVYYDDYNTELQFPVHYGDSLMDHFSGSRIISNQSNKRHGKQYFKADSYGTLIYSTGDTITDVMRVYSVEHIIDSMPFTYDSTTIYNRIWYKEGIRTPVLIYQVYIFFRWIYQTNSGWSTAVARYWCLDPEYINNYILSGCYANFSAGQNILCEGDSVAFTDLSFSTNSNVNSWQWSFEGGSPATSTLQNPVTTYNNYGDYDVQLIVSDGIYTDTLLKMDFIQVGSMPGTPDSPSGPVELCSSYSYNYTTDSVPFAASYNWQVIPADAGTITGDSTVAVLVASPSWTGSFDVRVRAQGSICTSTWSEPLTCTLYHNPIPFLLSATGDGVYCEGEPGSELTLDGSEIDVDYELYFFGQPTGNIVAGTGDSISFGVIDTEGFYTAKGFTDHCENSMLEQIHVHQMPVPGQAETPAGPEETCNDIITVYTTEEIEGADVFVWTLDPAEAGELAPAGDSVSITWNPGYGGNILLSVHGENVCGAGPESDSLEINLSLTPVPLISGSQFVNPGTEEQYQTEENPGNTYSWEVTGGDITSGGETHQVTVLWGEAGEGSLTVTEESPAGCSGISNTYWVVIGATSIKEKIAGYARIYPNPAQSKIYVDLTAQASINTFLTLSNTNGRQLITQPITEIKTEIDISHLPSGIYIVKVWNDKEVMVRKVIKR